MYRIEKISKITSKLPYLYVCGYMFCMQVSKLNLLCIQNTMPQMEEVAVDKVAYIIFPWQVEQVLHIKFPGEVSRAQEAGFVSCIMCEWHSVQAQLQVI